jgi:hypothetical protein
LQGREYWLAGQGGEVFPARTTETNNEKSKIVDLADQKNLAVVAGQRRQILAKKQKR